MFGKMKLLEVSEKGMKAALKTNSIVVTFLARPKAWREHHRPASAVKLLQKGSFSKSDTNTH